MLLPQNSLKTVYRTVLGASALTLLSFVCTGCGGSSDNLGLGAVSGKVTFNGQPVTGGSVMFNPIASEAKKLLTGKPAAAEVGSDGSFTLTTYAKNDGAAVGKHRVTFTPPVVTIDEKEHKEDSPPLPKSPLAGLVPSQAEVEVKAGSNTIDIQLVPDPKGAAGS
ncbi:MAG: hypothetical protein IAF94_14645 [Pirellulaceae bacterium]|nr:hypothetical protein [Pirellulaceae bacterium]